MFNGDRLRIARQRAGHTKKKLAEIMGVTPRAVTGWETNEYPPDPEKVQGLSVALGFPVSFFELDEVAQTPEGAVSFRSLTKKSAGQRDAVLAMCDLAKDVTAWIDDRFGLPSPAIPDLWGEEPRVAATLLRQEWGLGNRPIKNLVHLAEAKGVRVFSLAKNCREIDACSFWSDETPFILLDTTKSNERSRFDIAHEIGHLALHKHGAPMGRVAENEANAFASEFLMPEDSVRSNRPPYWSIPVLIERKKIWNVSVSALAYRAHHLGMISEWNFKSLNIEMRRRGYKEREPEGSVREQSKVLELILSRLREINMSLKFAANQMALPENELRGLIYGLAKVSIEGMPEAERGAPAGAHLRVVK